MMNAKRILGYKNIAGKAESRSTLLVLLLVGLLTGVGLAMWLAPQTPEPRTESESSVAAHIGEAKPLDWSAGVSSKTDESGVPSQPQPTEEGMQPTNPIEDVREAFGDRESLNVLPSPTYHLRPDSEWQGMLVDTANQAICEESSACGLGMACNENRCGPCSADSDCGTGESCVLDHCVPNHNVTCHRTSECVEGELCVLSGYSADPRGNESMQAFCQPSVGGTEPTPEEVVEPTADDPGPYAPPRAVSVDLLRDILSQHGAGEVLSTEPALSDIEQRHAKAFDEASAESEYERHESSDVADPEQEHEVVDTEAEDVNM